VGDAHSKSPRGIAQSASLGDFVWYDSNENGLQDPGEPGIEGVSVTLFRCDETMLETTTTDVNGFYVFSIDTVSLRLSNGDYYVSFQLPKGYEFMKANQGSDDALDSDVDRSTGRTACTNLVADENETSLDAGMFGLVLYSPGNIKVYPTTVGSGPAFINYIVWEEPDDSLATIFHAPDTTGWNVPLTPLPQVSLSIPSVSGVYSGDIDRTISFFAADSGRVGITPDIRIRYVLVTEEEWQNVINVGANEYSPGETKSAKFINAITSDTLDIGLKIQFSAGRIDSNGIFKVGVEDYEGFHIWRGVNVDGSDLVAIGELSKQEAFLGSPIDSFYYNIIIPTLRDTSVYVFPFPTQFGTRIDIENVVPGGKLGPKQHLWLDMNAFNGFTYYYTVTTFDRDFLIPSVTQGIEKFDNCQPTVGSAYPCVDELASAKTELAPQDDLRKIYVVPNPYRDGGSQFTTPNYHNFPDNKMRFYNVPADCILKIYTPAGDLVWETIQRSGTGNIEWDARNLSGNDVSSGIYIFRLETMSGDSVYGRIVVIR
jgi:hypothetical protein